MHSHGNALGAVRSGLASRCIDADTRLYLPMPFFWVGGFGSGVLSALLAGATLVTEEIPQPESTLRLLERERVTLFRGWPDQAEALAGTRIRVGADLSALRPGSLEALLPPEQRSRPGARANAVRNDRSVRAVLRLPRRYRHAATRRGAVAASRSRAWRFASSTPTSGQTRRGGNHRDDPDSAARTRCAASAGAAVRSCSPSTASTPPATSATSTTTALCSTTADPTTCSRSAAPPSIPARSSGRCAPSTVSTTPSSPTARRAGRTSRCGCGVRLGGCHRRQLRAQARNRLSSFKVPTVWFLADDAAIPPRRDRQGRHRPTTRIAGRRGRALARFDHAVFGEVVDQRRRPRGQVVRHRPARGFAVALGQRRHHPTVVLDRLVGPAADASGTPIPVRSG